MVTNSEGMELSIVRTESAGVFFGYVAEVNGGVVRLLDSRRVWYWDGAASLSQLAQEGTSEPDKCKIAVKEPTKLVRGWIEITPVTPAAAESLNGVKEWRA